MSKSIWCYYDQEQFHGSSPAAEQSTGVRSRGERCRHSDAADIVHVPKNQVAAKSLAAPLTWRIAPAMGEPIGVPIPPAPLEKDNLRPSVHVTTALTTRGHDLLII